ncbi:hypothetical protein B9G69_001155 [Bdellovibrio sp. SKB1291214]|uniref:hypothetical protein n=1 Tax=Bdellovibrio sp. SKB1291214 TaxID=1732569 RepID=UPI000B517839|nr:hypothetical protein [Bdellovibrio sp. SKB1291214]UYL09183.1 hypothetical protein B9G69_001155 [Bdellovibrio sp. SKB1291214]
MKTIIIQIMTVLFGFFLIFQATAAQAGMVQLRTAGLEKLSANLNDHEVQVAWEEPIRSLKCKLKSHLAVDDFTGRATNKMKAVASIEWQF